MPSPIYPKKEGYITLLSLIIVMVVGLAIGVSLLLLGSGALRTSFALQQSNLAQFYADSCTEEALFAISNDSTYAGSGSLTFNNDSCEYTVTHGSQSEVIDATGTVGNVIRKTQTTLNSTGFLWQEKL